MYILAKLVHCIREGVINPTTSSGQRHWCPLYVHNRSRKSLYFWKCLKTEILQENRQKMLAKDGVRVRDLRTFPHKVRFLRLPHRQYLGIHYSGVYIGEVRILVYSSTVFRGIYWCYTVNQCWGSGPIFLSGSFSTDLVLKIQIWIQILLTYF